MSRKIGRNDPCFCGSGRKYKKCHLNIPVNPTLEQLPPEVMEQFNLIMNKARPEAETLKKLGIYINYVKPIDFKGGKVWALGSTVYYNRPLNETFHEFIIDMLRLNLGQEWWEEQLKLPEDKRHFIMRCFSKYRNWIVKNSKTDNKDGNIWSAQPDGWTLSLVSITFDVISLIHAQKLPEHLINRLKNMNEFQGARYEISIAAIFARLGFRIQFLDDEQIQDKHCEFLAIDDKNQLEIAVEAKSKHRSGVLNYPGVRVEEKDLKTKVFNLFHQAVKKESGERPFIIFIDVNFPISSNTAWDDKPWVKEITEFRKNELDQNPDNHPKYNAVYFTNFSYHYSGEDIATSGEFITEIPITPQYPFKDTGIITKLYNALNNYGHVPKFDKN